jgi:hypothetical protein
MKNLFLTFALMFCVSFAFANEGDETMKPSEASPTVKVVGYQIITSCGTQIDMHADECNDTEMLDNAMYYECQHCGDC